MHLYKVEMIHLWPVAKCWQSETILAAHGNIWAADKTIVLAKNVLLKNLKLCLKIEMKNFKKGKDPDLSFNSEQLFDLAFRVNVWKNIHCQILGWQCNALHHSDVSTTWNISMVTELCNKVVDKSKYIFSIIIRLFDWAGFYDLWYHWWCSCLFHY